VVSKTIRMDENRWNWVESSARSNGVSQSGYIRMLVARDMDEPMEVGGKIGRNMEMSVELDELEEKEGYEPISKDKQLGK